MAAAVWLTAAVVAPRLACAEAPLADQLRQLLEAQRAGTSIEIAGQPLRQPAAVQEFYAGRVYEPVWSTRGRVLDRARRVLSLLSSAADDGLRPDDYHCDFLKKAISDREHRTAAVELELAMTDGVLAYASDMLRGRVRPETLYPSWESMPRELDLPAYLRRAIDGGRLLPALRNLAPRQPAYERLRKLLARYRRIAADGGLVELPEGKTLKPGMQSDAVAALRRRLEQSGDLSGRAAAGNVYDTTLQSAVQRYQTRHGLEPDGIAGAATVASLDRPASDWIRTIEINMERWRWLPQDLGERYITVNIAGFELDLVDKDKTRLSMGVVVGKRYHETPVFSAPMTHVVFNPYWEVPSSIAVKEIVPKLEQDPSYLDHESMKVFRGWEQPLTPVDPASIDWSRVDKSHFPYRFRQDPGPKNSLGAVKFMFPNKYDVYLHDTPAKELFSKSSRGFSHGCIRVSRPLDLATYLLADKPGWDASRIKAVEAGGQEQTVRLARPWPVHILYWTAWVADDGEVQFRPDVYGRDERLARALYNSR